MLTRLKNLFAFLLTKYRRTLTLATIFSCVLSGGLHAQNVDQRLWGVWKLETVNMTSNNVTKQYPFSDLLANKNLLPSNMFTSLYFFDRYIGADTSEAYLESPSYLNQKGSFSTDNGQLTITIYEKQPTSFNYTIEGETLKLKYTASEVQYELFFKLTLNTNQG